MEILNAIFIWLLRASWQASVLVGLVLLVQWVFGKKLSPGWRYALWLLVLFRLAMPVTPQSRLSVFNLAHLQAAHSPIATLQRFNDATASKPSAPTDEPKVRTPEPNPAAQAVDANEAAVRSTPTPRFTFYISRITFSSVLPLVWLSGVILLFVRIAWQNTRFARRVLKQRQVTHSEALDALEDCKEWMRLRTPLTVIETGEVKSPALYGFIRPRLVLPQGMLASFTAQELRYVFLHELAHVKRCDMAVNWLVSALRVLHWFNPVVWFAFRRMAADREVAADALALSRAAEQDREPYGQTIIKLLENFTRPAALPGLVGILEEKQQMRRRIIMIAQFKNSVASPAIALLLLTGMGLVALTDAQSKNAELKGGEKLIDAKAAMPRETALPSLIMRRLELPKELPEPFRWSCVFSPDGRKVAINPNSISGDYRHIDVVDLRDHSTVRVTEGLRKHTTNSFTVGWSMWTPDGRRLLFSYKPDDEDGARAKHKSSLCLVPSSGGDIQTIYESDDPLMPEDWSEDGKWILAIAMHLGPRRATYDLVMVPVHGGGEVRQLATKWGLRLWPSLSRDGRFIVFQRQDGEQWRVLLRSVEDGREIPLGPPDQTNFNPVWSRDGRYVVFKGNRSGSIDLWGQRVENGTPIGDALLLKRNVEQGTRLMQVLKDGRLVYSSSTPARGVYQVSVNEKTGEIVGKPKLIARGDHGAPSPDGNWIAYNPYSPFTGSASSFGLRVISIDGKEERTLKTDFRRPWVSGWFPDGKSLLLNDRGLYRFELSTAKVESIYTNASTVDLSKARLSPDAQSIVLARGASLEVLKREAGAQPVSLHRVTNEWLRAYAWSPDSRRIAFISGRIEKPPFTQRILTISANGGEPSEIARFEASPSISPEMAWSSKFIIHTRLTPKDESGNEKQQVWIIPASGGEPVHLKTLDEFANESASYSFRWSANGKELFFTGVDPKGDSTEFWTLENYLPEEKRAAK